MIFDIFENFIISLHKIFKWKPNQIYNKSSDEYQSFIWKGILHSDDGPAIITPSITIWMRYNKIHNDSGPAMIYSTSDSEFWYKEGMLHREDGPAVIVRMNYHPSTLNPPPDKSWYYYGKPIEPDELFQKLPKDQQIKIMFEDFEERFR